jgi:methylphosphotriester-DNA--protein-cysteine methyltransferase
MYRLHPPAPALAPYVEHYWAVDPSDGPVDLRVDVFVDGRADLIFNLGAPYERQVIGGPSTRLSASNLDAQRLVPIRILQRGEVRVIGLRFQLGGLAPFARVPLRPWTGQTPEPALVLGEGARALEAALATSADLGEAARCLDQFLLELLRPDEGRQLFERALRSLIQSEGAIEIGALAVGLGVSGRQLERLFSRYLGFAPKTAARVLRFQRSMRMLMRDQGVPLADVAIRAGYFDQAHFIRDFRRMTGGLPRGYRGYYPPAGPAHFAPNVVVFLQDRHR